MLKKIAILFTSLLCIQLGYSQCPDVIAEILVDSSVQQTIEVDPNGDNIIYYDICQGESIDFTSNVTYADGSFYPGVFLWTNNGGSPVNSTGNNYTFQNSGGYEIAMTIEDLVGCENYEPTVVYVRVSTTPSIQLSADPLTICPNTNSDIDAIVDVTPTPWSIDYNNTFAEELFIPDGPSCPPGAYETSINFNSFLPAQTLTNIDDFLRICIDMEHSWMGDIMINLHAPNGNTVVLLEDQNGGGVGNGMGGIDLGIPNNDDSFFNDCEEDENPAGTGFTYCWSPNPTTNNWHTLENNGNLQNPVQESNPATNTNIFADYNNSFNSIVNTPLNGTWTVEVIDTWGGDNGWIFQWWIDFNPDILPSSWSFTPTIVSGEWGVSPTTVAVNGNTMTVNPSAAGIYTYEYIVEDNYGCHYSEFIDIEALNGVELLNTTTIPDECTQGVGSATVEGFGGEEPYTYFWPSIGATGPTAVNLTSGSYPYVITDALGCTYEGVSIIDQVGVEVDLEVLETTSDACELGLGEMLVSPINGIPPFSYNWENSPSTSALGYNLPTGMQSVVVTDGNGCQGEISHFIDNIPPPTPEFSFYLDSCTNDLTLFNETDNTVSQQWQIGPITSFEESPTLHLNQGVIYPIKLIAYHEFCSDSLVEIIDLSLTNVYSRIKFPNVFTPNGDYSNDYFVIRGLKECDNGVLRIFNRWGDEVYYTLHPHAEPWDGKHLGKEVSDGTYFYVLELKYTQLKGSLNLYR